MRQNDGQRSHNWNKNIGKRILSFALSASLLTGSIPTSAFGASWEGDGLDLTGGIEQDQEYQDIPLDVQNIPDDTLVIDEPLAVNDGISLDVENTAPASRFLRGMLD